MKNMVSFFDHTLLKPEASQSQIENLCQEALFHGLYSVCVNGTWIPLISNILKNSSVLPITVVGFPLGASTPGSKAQESIFAINNGAKEIDMVLDIGRLKSGDWNYCHQDILGVVKACQKIPVKVIIETCYLSDLEIVQISKICESAGAAFVKTSTGFGSAGATAHHIRLIRNSISLSVGIKASGGIRTLAAFKEMVEAGATRVGSSNSVNILKEAGE